MGDGWDGSDGILDNSDAKIFRCLEMLSCLTSAGNVDTGAGNDPGAPSASAASATPAASAVAVETSHPLLKTNKRLGTVDRWDSIRGLLRFLGHAPLLHIEGIIWISTSGQKVHCIAAVSNWSLFLIVPQRGSSLVGGIAHGRRIKTINTGSPKLLEIALSSILEISMVSAREHLNTFAKIEANWVSRPFRVITKAPSDETLRATNMDDLRRGTSGGERVMTLVGFEGISKLRYFLMLARESWAIRTAVPGVPEAQMLPSTSIAAQRYLEEVRDAMTGSLRDEVDAQVELLEGLTDEMIFDTTVKAAFFSTGDVLFEIIRRVVGIIDGIPSAADKSVAAGLQNDKLHSENEVSRDHFKKSHQAALVDARSLSAAAAVFDAAFFHSLEISRRMDFVARPLPFSLPTLAEILVNAFFGVRRRLQRYRKSKASADDSGWSRQENVYRMRQRSNAFLLESFEEGRDVVGQTVSYRRTPSSPEDEEGEDEKRVLDHVVRAVNGISDAIILFNIEHENVGLVRNLVGVGLGRAWRSGVEPARSQTLDFLVAINDRTMDLIQELGLVERKKREVEEARRCRRNRHERAPPPLTTNDATANKSRRHSLAVYVYRLGFPGRSPDARCSKTNCGGGALSGEPSLDTAEDSEHDPLEEGNGKKFGEAGVTNHALGEVRHEEAHGDTSLEATLDGGGRPDSSSPRDSLLSSVPVILHSYAKLLNALVCGSYDLKTAFLSACEVDLLNLGQRGGCLDVLENLDGGSPRMVLRESSRFLREILAECDSS